LVAPEESPESGSRPKREAAFDRGLKTLREHQAGILAYYNFRISTGPLEGTNNKIKTMKREAYGYRDEEFFTLKIFAAHELKYALVG
jgi:transposase